MTPGPQSQELAMPRWQAPQTPSIRCGWGESVCKAWQHPQTRLRWIQTRFLRCVTSFQNSKSFCCHIELTVYKFSICSQRHRRPQCSLQDRPELPGHSSCVRKYQIVAIWKYTKSVSLCNECLSDSNGFFCILKMRLTFRILKAVPNMPPDHPQRSHTAFQLNVTNPEAVSPLTSHCNSPHAASYLFVVRWGLLTSQCAKNGALQNRKDTDTSELLGEEDIPFPSASGLSALSVPWPRISLHSRGHHPQVRLLVSGQWGNGSHLHFTKNQIIMSFKWLVLWTWAKLGAHQFRWAGWTMSCRDWPSSVPPTAGFIDMHHLTQILYGCW